MHLKQVATFQEGVGMRLAFGSDGRSFAAASDQSLNVFRAGKRVLSAQIHGGFDVRFLADGRHIAVAPERFDMQTQRMVELPPLFEPPGLGPLAQQAPQLPPYSEWEIYSATFTPDGAVLFVSSHYRPGASAHSGSYSGPTNRLLAIDAKTRQLLGVLASGKGFPGASPLVASDRHLAASASHLLIWERASLQKVAELDTLTDVWALAFSPDGSWLVAGGADGRVALFSTADFRKPRLFAAHPGGVRAVSIHPGSAAIATGGDDKQVRIFSFEGAQLGAIELPVRVEALIFDATGKQLLVAGNLPSPQMILLQIE